VEAFLPLRNPTFYGRHAWVASRGRLLGALHANRDGVRKHVYSHIKLEVILRGVRRWDRGEE
jgi:hypothetical protein